MDLLSALTKYFHKENYLYLIKECPEQKWRPRTNKSPIVTADDSGERILKSKLGLIHELSEQEPPIKAIISYP